MVIMSVTQTETVSAFCVVAVAGIGPVMLLSFLFGFLSRRSTIGLLVVHCSDFRRNRDASSM